MSSEPRCDYPTGDCVLASPGMDPCPPGAASPRSIPPPTRGSTAAERAALDRLEAWQRGEYGYADRLLRREDIDTLLVLARRADATPTPSAG